MAGFVQDPIQFINLIADNLRDRYLSGFPIIKELIQNANDAGATELHLGRSPGLSTARHELLRGPGFFVVNDGLFTEEDALAIRSFGQSSKASDGSVIGKFGLGMKSLFHFCEAFFFLGLDEGGAHKQEVLNPWSSEEPSYAQHTEWDGFSEADARLIREHLNVVLKGICDTSRPPFILWVPLRKREHSKEQGDLILQEFHGDERQPLAFLDNPVMPLQIGEVLPLLTSLRAVALWSQGEAGEYEEVFSVVLAPNAFRLSLVNGRDGWEDSHQEWKEELRGTVEIRRNGGNARIAHSGLERFGLTPELDAIRTSGSWPQVHIRRPDELAVQDKTRPHGAVVFSTHRSDNPKLETVWSVFLPLDHSKMLHAGVADSAECCGQKSYRLTLHGYFFLDAGRQEVPGLVGDQDLSGEQLDTEQKLRTAWNHEIARSHVLPLVLPALSRLCEDQKLDGSAIEALSKALNSSKLMDSFRKTILAEYAWVREIQSHGTAWRLIPVDQAVRQIPLTTPKSPELLFRVLPGLDELAQSALLIDQEAPNLISRKPRLSEDELCTLIESIKAPSAFAARSELGCLASFLELTLRDGAPSQQVTEQLIQLLHEGFLIALHSSLEEPVRRIVACLPESRVLEVDLGTGGTQSALFEQLVGADVGLCLCPKKLLPRGFSGKVKISTDCAVSVLSVIDEASWRADAFDSGGLAAKVVAGVFDCLPTRESCQLVSRQCAGRRVFQAFDCSTGAEVLRSGREVREAYDDGRLFQFSSGFTLKDRKGLAPLLQQVTPQEPILLMSGAWLGRASASEEPEVSACDTTGVLRFLGQRIRVLGDQSSRAKLAQRLQASGELTDAQRRGLRYLLHAKSNHFEDCESTLWRAASGGDDVWRKLWAQVVPPGDRGIVLDDDGPVRQLSAAIADELGVKQIEPASVLLELSQQDANLSKPEAFSDEECERILLAVEDPELWLRLPLHQSVDGRRISAASESTYLKPEESRVPEGMLQFLQLIERSLKPDMLLRQEEWLRPLDERQIIRIAIENATALDAAWRIVLDALNELSKAKNTRHHGHPESDAEAEGLDLSGSKWLPDHNGVMFDPNDVVDLPKSQRQVAELLERAPSGTFTTPDRLATEVTEHLAFERLQAHFAHGEDAVETIALVMSDLDDYQVGELQIDLENTLEELVGVLADYQHPGWRLLGAIQDEVPSHACLRRLLPEMISSLAQDEIVRVLQWLPASEPAGEDKKARRAAFSAYLSLLGRTAQDRSVLRCLRLLNQSGEWCLAERLVSGKVNAAPRHLLSEEHEKLLKRLIDPQEPRGMLGSDASSGPGKERSHSTAAGLRSAFGGWLDRVPSTLLAAFICLLGRGEDVKALCEEYLGQHSRDWLLCQFPWQKRDNIYQRSEASWLPDASSLKEAIRKLEFQVELYRGETFTARSILGEPIEVSVGGAEGGLIVEPPEYEGLGFSGYRVGIKLRCVGIAEHSDAELNEFLKNSIERLFRDVYDQNSHALEGLFQTLSETDQVDVDLARSMMLRNLPFYLRQLGVQDCEVLKAKLDDFRTFERREMEFARSEQKGKECDFREKKENALRGLQSVLESDPDAQRTTLEAIRRKIAELQYQGSRVPFELFQNADDAVSEWKALDATSEPPECVRRTVVKVDGEALVFMHWGRPINKSRCQGGASDVNGFDRDLENMLIVSASDKTTGVTGKFGLGFKSVWLVSDQPTLVSGRLQAAIVGGLLPIKPEDTGLLDQLRELLREQQSPPNQGWPGTAVHLPLRQDTPIDILEEFKKECGLLAVFSREIRNIEVRDADGSRRATWNPRQVLGLDGVWIGEVPDHTGEPIRLMKLDLDEGAIALAVGVRGFRKLPEELPSLWVTAPIQEDVHLGFALNAMFAIDAGRSRLAADTTDNERLAQRLGRMLRDRLEELESAARNQWQDLAKAMRLAPDATPYAFWGSFWDAVVTPLGNLKKDSRPWVIAQTLLAEALGEWMVERDVVPNRLPEPFQKLLKATDVASVVEGALSKPEVLRAVVKSGCFVRELPIEQAVSPDVRTWFRHLGKSYIPMSGCNLEFLFRNLLRKKPAPVTDDDASALGSGLNDAHFTMARDQGGAVWKDFHDARQRAASIQFRSAAGGAAPSSDLLVAERDPEEQRRWAFAPDDCRLSGDYRSPGVDFFLWCRGSIEAGADKLARWVVRASDSERRKAALAYLVEGRLSHEVTHQLHGSGLNGTWLTEVDEGSDLLADLDASSRDTLLYKALKSTEETKSAFLVEEPAVARRAPSPIDAQSALDRVFSWWEAERLERIAEYREQTYPRGRKLELTEEWDDDSPNGESRSDWLTLLVLGSLHTMGRSRPEQHRGFIERCEDRGWWDVFRQPKPHEAPDRWMAVLDQYVQEQIDDNEYEQWVRQFPVIYKLARYLDEYAELLRGLDRYPEEPRLDVAFSPRADSHQQGGGVDAPPLAKTLGIGSNFVVRELMRFRVITNTDLDCHAYVPSRRVRQFLAWMGWVQPTEGQERLLASKSIHNFLTGYLGAERARFCGDYDIPLIFVAGRPELQLDLVGAELGDGFLEE